MSKSFIVCVSAVVLSYARAGGQASVWGAGATQLCHAAVPRSSYLIAALVRSARRSLCVRLGWSVAMAAEAWAQGVARRPCQTELGSRGVRRHAAGVCQGGAAAPGGGAGPGSCASERLELCVDDAVADRSDNRDSVKGGKHSVTKGHSANRTLCYN